MRALDDGLAAADSRGRERATLVQGRLCAHARTRASLARPRSVVVVAVRSGGPDGPRLRPISVWPFLPRIALIVESWLEGVLPGRGRFRGCGAGGTGRETCRPGTAVWAARDGDAGGGVVGFEAGRRRGSALIGTGDEGNVRARGSLGWVNALDLAWGGNSAGRRDSRRVCGMRGGVRDVGCGVAARLLSVREHGHVHVLVHW